jgi:sugar transferase (PEP-CTERM/EpsH1 system associated)
VRLLFLTHRLPYAPNRGDRIRAYHLLRVLSRDHEVHLVSLVHDADEAARADSLGAMTASIRVARVSRARQLVAAGLALPGNTPLTHVLLRSREMHAILEQYARDRPPDVVIAYGTGMAPYAMDGPLASRPCVLDMVDVDSEKWAALARSARQPMRAIYKREARLLRQFEQRALGRACMTLVVNDREQRLVASLFEGATAVVVPNGIDVQSFAPPTPPADDPRVVFCGVFNYEPNEAGARWFASEVWPLVTAKVLRAQLSLVGMHPTAAVRALANNPSIEVTGAVDEVPPYLWRSAVSVAPLHLARGLQNKVLEAIAAGLPCVVTRQVLDGLPETARAACRAASDPADFANAVVSLLETTAANRRALASQADLRPLSWEQQLKPMTTLLEDCRRRTVDRLP